MKTLVLASTMLLFCGVVSAQAKSDKTPPAVKPAVTAPAPQTPAAAPAIPQLTPEEKDAVLSLQRDIAQDGNIITDAEKDRDGKQNQLNAVALKISQRLGTGYIIDNKTLAVSVDPNAPKKDETPKK